MKWFRVIAVLASSMQALLKVSFRGWQREVAAARLFNRVTTEHAARSEQAETRLAQLVDTLVLL